MSVPNKKRTPALSMATALDCCTANVTSTLMTVDFLTGTMYQVSGYVPIWHRKDGTHTLGGKKKKKKSKLLNMSRARREREKSEDKTPSGATRLWKGLDETCWAVCDLPSPSGVGKHIPGIYYLRGTILIRTHHAPKTRTPSDSCLLYTSDAADE